MPSETRGAKVSKSIAIALVLTLLLSSQLSAQSKHDAHEALASRIQAEAASLLRNPFGVKYDEVKALADEAESIAPDDENTAVAILLLGVLQCLRTDYKSCLSSVQRSLSIIEKLPNSEAAAGSIVLTLNFAGSICTSAGQYDQAQVLLERSIELGNRVLHSRGPQVASTSVAMAVLCNKKLDERCVSTNLGRALEFAGQDDVRASRDPAVASFLKNLAVLLRDRGENAKAASILQHALAIEENVLGSEQIETNMTLLALGQLHVRLHEYTLADKEIHDAANRFEKMYGSSHPLVAIAIDSQAQLDLAIGKESEAEALLKRAVNIYDATEDPGGENEPSALNQLASIYINRGDHVNVERTYRKLLSIREKKDGPKSKSTAEALQFVGSSLVMQGKYTDAEPILQRVVAIQNDTEQPDSPAVAVGVANLGYVYFKEGKADLAKQLTEKALSYYERPDVNSPDMAARLLDLLGDLETASPNHAAAEHLFRKELEFRTTASGPDHPLTAILQLKLASILLQKNDFAGIKPLAENALATREKQFGATDESLLQPLDLLVLVATTEKKYELQLTMAERAVSITEKSRSAEATNLGYRLYMLALSHLFNNQVDLALQSFQQAEPLLEAARKSNPKQLAADFIQFGWALANIGQIVDAERIFEKGLNICEKQLGPNDPMITKALTGLGWVNWLKGEFALAEQTYERAVSASELGNGPTHAETIATMGNLARAYVMQEKYAKAEPLLQRLITVYRQVPTTDLTRELNLLGNTYFDEREMKYARLAYEAVVVGCNNLGNEKDNCRATALFNLGQTYLQQNDFAKAEPLLRRSVGEYDKTGTDHLNTANALQRLAEALQHDKKTREAESALRRAQAIISETLGTESPSLASLSWDLALLQMDTGRLSEALEQFQRAIEIDNKNLGRALLVGSELQRFRYMSTIGENGRYRRVFGIEPTAVANPKQALLLGAELIIQRKGLVQEAVADELSNLRRLEEPAIRTKLDELSQIRTKIANLVLGSTSNVGTNQDTTELQALQRQNERLEVEISRRSAGFRQANQPVTIKQIQSRIPKDAVLVEYLQFIKEFTPEEKTPKSHTYTMPGVGGRMETYSIPEPIKLGIGTGQYVAYLFFSDGDPLRVDLGDADYINASALEFRAAMSNVQNEAKVRRLARGLDEKLMRPIRKLLGGRDHIFVSPDGDLSLIPFAALRDESGHYLAERYEFTYLESGRSLLRFASASPNRQGPKVYANPTFGNDSHRLSLRRSADRDAVGTMNFAALPATETEALQIASLLGNDTPLTGLSATKASLRALHGPEVLHIATHGVFLKDLPVEGDNLNVLFDFTIQPGVGDDTMYRSGLVFSDGILSAAEVANLDLWGTQLVTLSACETGLGEIHNGEGVVGLRRAFVLAGARSVLMSLWKVDDELTLDLMLAFYQAILRGEPKSRALRAAQLDLIKQGREPYYWAAWILSGDSGPLALDKK